jgi:hypothetical protein
MSVKRMFEAFNVLKSEVLAMFREMFAKGFSLRKKNVKIGGGGGLEKVSHLSSCWSSSPLSVS